MTDKRQKELAKQAALQACALLRVDADSCDLDADYTDDEDDFVRERIREIAEYVRTKLG